MISTNDLDRLTGMDVIGPNSEKIGSVDTPYVDDRTNQPSFVSVDTGLFGLKSSFVPLQGARIDGDALRVAYDEDRVKDAPRISEDEHLSPEEESQLYRHYGLEPDSAVTGDGTGMTTGEAQPGETTDPGSAGGAAASGTDATRTADDQTDDAMTRSEEELEVGTRRRPAGRARLRKHVVTEHVTRTVPVEREEVRVEREPIDETNVDQATSGPALSDDEHEVILTEEEPVVEKRAVPKERVRLDTETHTDEETVEDDVAREEIDLNRLEESRQQQGQRRS